MFEGQFIFRMILTAVCTVLFVYGAIWQARNHPVEKTKKRGVLRLAIAVLFAVLSLVYAATAVMVIQDPHISAALNKFGTQGLVYTSQQFAFLRVLLCAIVFLIIACYLFFFKKGNDIPVAPFRGCFSAELSKNHKFRLPNTRQVRIT